MDSFLSNQQSMYWKRKISTETRKTLKEAVYKKYSSRCKFCGSGTSLEIHHKIYRWRPRIEDCELLCKQCHQKLNIFDAPLVVEDTISCVNKTKFSVNEIQILNLCMEPLSVYDLFRITDLAPGYIHKTLHNLIRKKAIIKQEPTDTNKTITFITTHPVDTQKELKVYNCPTCKQPKTIHVNQITYVCHNCKRRVLCTKKSVIY